LADDDHTQYILAAGTRAFTGDQSMGTHKITSLAAHTANGNAVRYEHLALDEHTQYLRTDGTRALTGNQSAGGNKITSLGAATANGDAVRYEQLTSVRSVWDARAVPTGLASGSDEFDDGSVDASWNDWDHGAYVTTTEESSPTGPNRLRHTGTHAADTTLRLAGKYKAIPANEFQALAYCAVDGGAAGSSSLTHVCGLAVLQDGASSTGDLATAHISFSSPDTSAVENAARGVWTAYNAISSAISRDVPSQAYWLRIRHNVAASVSVIETDWSIDGVHWTRVGAGALTLGYQAQHIALVAGNSQNGGLLNCYHQHFRMFTGAGSSAYDFKTNGNYLGT